LPSYISAPFITSERMYLDTMQQILSKSSKIVVDGKSGNLLYLPLDKLMSSTSPLALENPDKSVNSDNTNNQDKDSNMFFDGRETSRPTEHLGRGN